MSSPSDCLAGLDAVVLDINRMTPSRSVNISTTTPEDVSWVVIPRAVRKGKGPAGRAPLGDKTREFNIANHSPLSGTPPRAQRAFTIYRDEPIESVQSPIGLPSSSFHPLPLVPPTSSLQLPSFRDFSLNSITSPRELVRRAPSDLPSSTQRPSTFPPPIGENENRAGNKTEIQDNLYRIPAFQHPNSPYVPWTLPIRRQILHPLTSASELTVVSTTYSRSGARAPEPGEDAVEKLPASRTWRNIRRTVFQNVQQVTKRFVKSLKLEKPAPAIGVHHASDDARHIPERLSSSPRRNEATPLRSPSSYDSVMSTDSNSLAVWLAARQREAMDRDNEPTSLMTLEEYECMGSWIDVGKAANGTWSCGVPQCKLHLSKAVASSGEETTVRLSNDCSNGTAAAKKQIPTSSPSYTSSPSQSMPKLPSLTSRWFESVEQLAPSGTYTTTNVKADKHRSMPGGWTFPL